MSLFTRNRAKARQEKAERYHRIDHFYEKMIGHLEKLKEFVPDKDATATCSLCKHWEVGDLWQAGEYGIEAEGRCSKALGLYCWNYRNACKLHFERKKMNGFIYCGGDGKSLKEDLMNVMALTEQVINDNMKE